MRDFDLVVRGGTVVTAGERSRCDVGVRDGRIAALAVDLGPGVEEVDAAGRLVLPGGVDAHCHIDQTSSSGLVTADDFYSGGVSAACGGTTTFIPFAAQHRGQSLTTVVGECHERARGKAYIDYGLHLIVSDPTREALEEDLPRLIEKGYTSFKIYMTYDALKLSDGQALDVLSVARDAGALVMVHAENSDIVAWLSRRLVAEGRTAPRYHAASRPPFVEREATHRALALAEAAGAPIVIVHVSSAEALEEIGRAQRRGVRAYAETCPQYLALTAADLDRPGFEGAKYMCSPPPREAADQEALWIGLATGAVDIFSSDHAPYRYDDAHGKKAHGEHAPFTRIPNGVPSIEIRMPWLFSEGVRTGRLDIHRFVAVTATNPAKRYGLYPRKGTIVPGADADLTVWDPDLETTITADMLHDRMDYTPFEGTTLKGWPVVTIGRGEVICEDGRITGRPGRGAFLPRCRHA